MYCGKQIDDQAKFCEYCGSQVFQAETAEEEVPDPSADYSAEKTPDIYDEDGNIKDTPWGWRGYIAAVFALTGMIFLGLASAPIVYTDFQPSFFDVVLFIGIAFVCFILVYFIWKEPGEESSEEDASEPLISETFTSTSGQLYTNTHESERISSTSSSSPSAEPGESSFDETRTPEPASMEPSMSGVQAVQPVQPLNAQPQSRSQPQKTYTCQTCGNPLTYVNEYQRWYCYTCTRYV
ncbi:MAG: zinc ribbon domain-containing protein [Thermoplasmata archaeon]|nr:zinc ribbon domain-containing protein [Thermoplasmata archaeon]